MLKRSAAGLTLPVKVEMMRYLGLPEPKILDYVAHRYHPTIHARGGPRDENEVRVRAARALLAMPLASAPGTPSMAWVFRPGSQPVAAGPKPIVPSPGRHP